MTAADAARMTIEQEAREWVERKTEEMFEAYMAGHSSVKNYNLYTMEEAYLAGARRERERWIDRLRSIEFVQPTYNGTATCPACEFYGSEPRQHKPGCWLAAVLKGDPE